eukprot:6193938-Pleurochrysis_carterae.AAC.2
MDCRLQRSLGQTGCACSSMRDCATACMRCRCADVHSRAADIDAEMTNFVWQANQAPSLQHALRG